MQRTALRGFLAGSGVAALALLFVPDAVVPEVEAHTILPPTAVTANQGLLTVRTALDRSALSSKGPQVRYAVVELTADDQVDGDVPVHVSLVMDTSGSMSGQKLADAKLAAEALVGQLEPGDSVSLVGFATRASTFQAPTTIHHLGSTLDGLAYLDAGGDTNMSEGLWSGISNLNAVTAHGSKRLVLLGDGHATAGSTGTSSLASIATGAQKQGITVSALGLGLDFDVETMAAVADAGGGRYHYVESPSALAGMLADELREADQLAAQSVTVEISPAAGVTVLDVFGYESWDGRATSTGWEALVGDMSGGATRKVVAKLQVDPELAGDALGQVSVSFADPATGVSESVQHRLWSVTSDDPEVLERAVDDRAVALVGQVHEGRAREQAAALRREGRVEGADAVLDTFSRELASLSSQYKAPGLRKNSEKLEAQRLTWRGVEAGSRAEMSLAAEEQLRALGYVE